MENVSYFLFKERFRFLSRFFSYVVKRLDKKTMVNFKIYDVTEQQVNTIHILPNIARRKGNKKLEFDQKYFF